MDNEHQDVLSRIFHWPTFRSIEWAIGCAHTDSVGFDLDVGLCDQEANRSCPLEVMQFPSTNNGGVTH